MGWRSNQEDNASVNIHEVSSDQVEAFLEYPAANIQRPASRPTQARLSGWRDGLAAVTTLMRVARAGVILGAAEDLPKGWGLA